MENSTGKPRYSKLVQRRLAREIQDLPGFPRSVQKILQMTRDINCMPRDLVYVLEHDPILTGHLLRQVNSAYFALARRVESVRHALVYLGLNTIKHLAMSVAALGAMPRVSESGVETDLFLRRSLAVGEIARVTAEKEGLTPHEVDQLFLMGLFHNLGDVLVAVHFSDLWKELREMNIGDEALFEKEREILGSTRYEISSKVAEKWDMSEDMVVHLSNFACFHPDRTERPVSENILFAALHVVQVLDGQETAPLTPEQETHCKGLIQDLLDDRAQMIHCIERALAVLGSDSGSAEESA